MYPWNLSYKLIKVKCLEQKNVDVLFFALMND